MIKIDPIVKTIHIVLVGIGGPAGQGRGKSLRGAYREPWRGIRTKKIPKSDFARAEQLQETPGRSDRQIAAGLGVSQPTVSKTRAFMEDGGELIKVITSIGADGKERPRQVARRPVAIYNPTPAEQIRHAV